MEKARKSKIDAWLGMPLLVSMAAGAVVVSRVASFPLPIAVSTGFLVRVSAG